MRHLQWSSDDATSALTGSFLARIDALLDSAPAVLRSPAEQAAFLGCYLDILLAHRPVAGLLAHCPVIAGACACDSIQLHTAADSVHQLLAGPEADLTTRIRAVMAVAGLHGTVASREYDGSSAAKAIRSTAVASSLAVLGGPRR